MIKWLTGNSSPSTADEYDVASDDEDEEDKEKVQIDSTIQSLIP